MKKKFLFTSLIMGLFALGFAASDEPEKDTPDEENKTDIPSDNQATPNPALGGDPNATMPNIQYTVVNENGDFVLRIDMTGIQDENEDFILFIEDIAEPIYKVNRMLWRLLHSGVLRRMRGLVVGQFTEYKPDTNYPGMEEMIWDLLKENGLTDIPVAFNIPIGHTDLNFPVVIGSRVELDVNGHKVSLKSI